jgi:hypothetical protein
MPLHVSAVTIVPDWISKQRDNNNSHVPLSEQYITVAIRWVRHFNLPVMSTSTTSSEHSLLRSAQVGDRKCHYVGNREPTEPRDISVKVSHRERRRQNSSNADIDALGKPINWRHAIPIWLSARRTNAPIRIKKSCPSNRNQIARVTER